MDKAKEFDGKLYLKVLVASSLGLQILLYVVVPRRKRSTSRVVLGLISIIFSLSNWIPAVTLMLITSCVVFSNDGGTTGPESQLLTWASLMLLHLAGYGQERKTPLFLHPSENANNEYLKVIIESLFYLVIFLIAFSLHSKSWNNETSPFTLGFMLLACFKTIIKLKRLRKSTGPYENIIRNNNNNNNITKSTTPSDACREIEAEIERMYYTYYGGAVSSSLELLIIFVLTVHLYSSPFLITFISAYQYVILSAILPIMIITINFKVSLTLLSKTLLTIVPLSCFLSFFICFLFILLIRGLLSFPDLSNMPVPKFTLVLVNYPIILNNVHQTYTSGRYQWRRWSRTILRFNILKYSLRKPPKISASIHHMLNTWPLSGKEQYTDNVGEFVFTELRNIIIFYLLSDVSHRKLTVKKQISAAKGLSVIKQNNLQDLVDDCEAPFVERVLLWHVATGIMYHTNTTTTTQEDYQSCFMSMLLSDYMGYLLIVQPWIMSKQRGAVLQRCLELWAEIHELIKDSYIQDDERICEMIINQQQSSKMDQIKTVLQGAYVLAKNLESTFPDANQRWSFIATVWVEKLAYAATQCSPSDHIQGLSQGGELATIVWLWILHFETTLKSVSDLEFREKESKRDVYSLGETSSSSKLAKKMV